MGVGRGGRENKTKQMKETKKMRYKLCRFIMIRVLILANFVVTTGETTDINGESQTQI